MSAPVRLADTVRCGDPDPEPTGDTCCKAVGPPPWHYLCTRGRHDRGQHVATDGRVVLDVWPYDGEAS